MYGSLFAIVGIIFIRFIYDQKENNYYANKVLYKKVPIKKKNILPIIDKKTNITKKKQIITKKAIVHNKMKINVKPEATASCQNKYHLQHNHCDKSINQDVGKFALPSFMHYIMLVPPPRVLVVSSDCKVGIALDACMKEHYKELSQACIKAEFQHFKKESKNERQNPLMKSKCAADINRFCKAFPGDMVTCLGGKMALLSKPCRLIVELEKRTRRVDIRLNGGLFGACAADIGKHCKNLPPGRGAILSCLKEKQRDTNIALDTGCQKLLTKDIRKASKDANVSKYIYSCLRLADYLTCPPNLKKTAPLVPH